MITKLLRTAAFASATTVYGNCYGYNKTMLMEVLRQQKKLPRIAWAELDSSHEVVAICYGESGYHKWEPEGYIICTGSA